MLNEQYRDLTDAEIHQLSALIGKREAAQDRLYDLVMKLHGKGVPSQQLADVLGVSRSTFYRLVLEMGSARSSQQRA